MIANEASFPGGDIPRDMYLSASGFGRSSRSGGLKNAKLINLPRGAVLVRFHDGAKPYGPWWITPYELERISRYFGVDGPTLLADRGRGKSALHGCLALLSEWYGHRSDQLARLTTIRLTKPFYAVYGEGYPAIRNDHSTLKPVVLDNNATARQLFLPDLSYYKADFAVMVPSAIAEVAIGPAMSGAAPLPFES